MHFSAKAEYGVLAVLDLALNNGQRPVQVRGIAARQGIPVRFLEQVMSSLKKAGVVESIRGAQGGYILARSPDEISLGDIVKAIDGPIASSSCLSERREPLCQQASGCVVMDVWTEIKSGVLNLLDSITVQELCERKRKKDLQPVLMYHI